MIEYVCLLIMKAGWAKVPIQKSPVKGTGKSQQAVKYGKAFDNSSK